MGQGDAIMIKNVCIILLLSSILLLAVGCGKKEPQEMNKIEFANDVQEVEDKPGSKLDELRPPQIVEEIVEEPEEEEPEQPAEEVAEAPEEEYVPSGPAPVLSSSDDVWQEIDAVVESLG